MSTAARKVFVLAGAGNAAGVGGATARLFSQAGYRIALISRGSSGLTDLANSLNTSGGEAAPFPISSYSYPDISSSFSAIRTRWPDAEIRVALFNAGVPIFKPFLQTTQDDFHATVNTNVLAASAFAREAVLAFQAQSPDEHGKRGTLLFTGASAALRGGPVTSAFSMGKHALRALSQSLNKEFGKENIHVAHTVVDGLILQDMTIKMKGDEWAANPDVRLDPESVAKAYMYLVNQDRSAWTAELDLRPAHEKW